MARELPILFKSEMVKAILEGRKTQTRRIIKALSNEDISFMQLTAMQSLNGRACAFFDKRAMAECPFGESGDLLWVRETWCPNNDGGYWYAADKHDFEIIKTDGDGFQEFRKDGSQKSPWKPSIHMPKAAARIWLQVESVGVERLKDINEEDAIAEGIEIQKQGVIKAYRNYADHMRIFTNPKDSYQSLWTSINGPDSWEQNPWVWVVKFSVN